MADWTTNAQVSSFKAYLDYRTKYTITSSSVQFSIFSNWTNLTDDELSKILHYNDTANCTSLSNTFQNCSTLTKIPLINTSNVTQMNSTFYGCTNLKYLPALDVGKVNSLTSLFSSANTNLEEIHFINIKGSFRCSQSTKFTREALVEIIGNLVDVGASRTLTIGSTNLAKLTEDDIAVATAKGWTIA